MISIRWSHRRYQPVASTGKGLDRVRVLGIITEGRGTQFEPRLVDVFLDNFPEFVNVLQKYKDVTSSPGMRKTVKLIAAEDEVKENQPEPVLS